MDKFPVVEPPDLANMFIPTVPASSIERFNKRQRKKIQKLWEGRCIANYQAAWELLNEPVYLEVGGRVNITIYPDIRLDVTERENNE